MSDVEYLTNLCKELWRTTAPSRGFPNGMAVEARRLTEEEWVKVKDILDRGIYIYQMSNACMGFGCGMSVGEMHSALYPGLPEEVTWHLFITNDHLPASETTRRNQVPSFKDGWRVFSPYTHSDSNRKSLEAYKLEPPQAESHYEY